MRKPKVPKHSICDKTMHADTLGRVASILDFLSDMDDLGDRNINAGYGLYWINRTMTDSVRYVRDSLSYEAQEKRERREAKRQRKLSRKLQHG